MSELSANATKVMELVEGLTIVELADLVSAMEEKFGVSAAAPVAVVAGGALLIGGGISWGLNELDKHTGFSKGLKKWWAGIVGG